MRLVRVAVLTAGLLAAASCYSRVIVDHFGTPQRLVLLDPMPTDFGVSLSAYDEQTPRTALETYVQADGQARWRVWVLATTREVARGEYQADAAHVASIWRAVVDARFDRIDAGETAPDGSSWTERLAVTADGAERFIWRPVGAADVAGVRDSLLATLPAEALTAFGR